MGRKQTLGSVGGQQQGEREASGKEGEEKAADTAQVPR